MSWSSILWTDFNPHVKQRSAYKFLCIAFCIVLHFIITYLM